MKDVFTILRNIVNGIKNAKAYTDTAEQNAKDYTDTQITNKIDTLTIVRTVDIADINAGYNNNGNARIMWYYTGGESNFYISFDYYWIRMQFRTQGTTLQKRIIYGNTTGSWANV